MVKKSVKAISLALSGSVFLLWMLLNTFIVSSFGISLVLSAVVIGAIQYWRIPPVDESRVSDVVLSLFDVDKNNPKKSTIFHKAGASFAPGNTLEAVQKSIELGIVGVEIDVNFSKDGVGVLFHGPHVEETTDGTGLINELTFEELQFLNVSAKDPNKEIYPVTRIPKLEDCVVECIKNDKLIFFDCKGDTTLTVTAILDLYKKYPELYRLGIVCSFYPQTIYALRQRDSNILTALTIRYGILEYKTDGILRNKELWKRIVSPFLDRILFSLHLYVFWYFIGNSFVLLEKNAVSVDFKKFWEQLGVGCIAWTVNCPLERQYLVNHGVPVITDGLTTETLKVDT